MNWPPIIASARDASEQWEQRADWLAAHVTAPLPWPAVPPALAPQLASAATDRAKFDVYDHQGKVWRARAQYLERYPVATPTPAPTYAASTSYPYGTPGYVAARHDYISSYSGGGGSRGTAVQCSATTKSGARCTRMTTNASGLCWQHGGG